MAAAREETLGLRANAPQFALLVLVNAFVGAIIGIERAVLPLLAEREFHVASAAAALGFIASFGSVKALSNLASGRLADRWGRKPLLVAGWLAALPVPLLIIYAPSWGWIVAANALLGVNQGLAWSMTVVSKVDLVGPRQRGLAMGLNEFAGYLSVGVFAFVGWRIAETFGLRPWPFLLAEALAIAGLGLSILFVRETRGFALREGAAAPRTDAPAREWPLLGPARPKFVAAAQAGLVNNLNDAVAWGLIPIFLLTLPGGAAQVGLVAALYPASWGVLQLATGPLSDRWGRTWMIGGGMIVQACALALLVVSTAAGGWLAASLLLGLGTAMVYPTLLAAVSDDAPPAQRGGALGAYRFWRDAGYVLGALAVGALADAMGLRAGLLATSLVTLASGVAYLALARR